jgi:hypothetical protein
VAQQSLVIANVLQDEVARRLGIAEPEKEYNEEDCGVFYHAWCAQGQGRHVHMLHAKNQMVQEIAAAALAGDIMPLVDR